MSSYNGRRGPNVSQYIRNLNAINPQEPAENAFIDEDLALFTNTNFFDLDSCQNTDFQAAPVKPDAKTETASGDVSAAQSVMGDMPLDFMSNDFSFQDFSGYPAPGQALSGFDAPQTFPQSNGSQMYSTPSQMSVQPPYSQAATPAATPQTGEKRKAAEPATANSANGFEEVSRQAAEEDKRRRNTAASARFRVKKKQREQALAESAKEMSEKLSSLESKVSQLETENKWLKNLLVEKNEGNESIATLWKEFTKQAGDKLKATQTTRQ